MKSQKKQSVGFLFDDTLDSSDGVAQYVKSLGGWLSGRGHNVCYLVGETKLTDWAGGPVYSLSKNQTVYFNGNRLSIPLPASQRRIKRILTDRQLDVLHVMVPYSPLLAQKVISLADSDTAVVGTFHIFPAGRLARGGSRLLKLWLSRSLARFDAVVSVSPAAGTFAAGAYGLDTYVIPNPVDVRRFGRGQTKQHLNRIVFLGRLVKRKGAAQLIDAFYELKQSVPGAKLIIAGDGPERTKLESQTRRMGLSDDIEFKGFIEESDKPALLAGAAVACFPSLYGEAFGIVLIEAMAAGAGAILAGDNPGYASVLGDQPVMLVDPTDRAAFAERLKHLLQNRELRAELHSWQLEQVQIYDINVVGRQIEDLYNGQIARRVKKSNNKAHE